MENSEGVENTPNDKNNENTMEENKTPSPGSKGSEAGAIGDTPGEWPDSVGFRENDPKKGMVYLILRLDPLITQVPFRGEGIALNGQIINEENTFSSRDVDFRLRITSGEDEGKIYQYKKALPKEIVPSGSVIKFDKNGQVKLRLQKTKPELSWAHHRDHLTLPDQ